MTYRSNGQRQACGPGCDLEGARKSCFTSVPVVWHAPEGASARTITGNQVDHRLL